MEKTIRTIDPSTREVTVELSKTDLDGYVEEAVTTLGKQITIDGFRKGKAPKDVIRKNINEAQLREEALRLAVEKSLSDVVKEEKLDVLDQNDFSVEKNTPELLKYKVKLILYPVVELGEYKGIEVKRKVQTVEDSEIEKVLKDVANSRAKLESADRPAEKGDQVEVDFTLKLKDKVIAGGESKNHPLILGENRFIPGFEEQILGMKVGDTKEFVLPVPNEYHEKEIAGKDLNVSVTLRDVKSRVISELTNEFAKTLGNFNSMEDVRKQVKEGLLSEKEAREKDRIRLEILKAIIKNTKLTVPDLMIEQQLDAMIKGFDSELQNRGMELGPYLAHLKKTEDELRKEWRPRGEEQVKMSLVVHAVAKAEKFGIEESELEDELQNRIQQYMSGRPDSSAEDVQKLDLDRARREIHMALLNNKVFDFLESKAILSE